MSFPADLNVTVGDKSITIDVPKDLLKDFKAYIDKWPKQPPNKIILSPVPRKNLTKEIKGGTRELRYELLVEALEHFGLWKQPVGLVWDASILHFIDKRVTPTMTQKEFEELPDFMFSPFKLYKQPSNPPEKTEFKSDPITVGPLAAAFILGTFGTPESYKVMDDFYQDEQVDSFVVTLNIPVPVYALITRDNKTNKFTFKFTQMDKATPKSIHDIIDRILTNAESDPCIKISLQDAEQFNVIKANELIASLGCYSTGNQNYESRTEDIPSSTGFVFCETADDEKFKQAADAVFKYFEYHMCKKCKCVYPISEKECYLTYHKGKRLPFPDGEMEIVDPSYLDENDEPSIMQNWSCCGEVYADDPGCGKKPNGEHEIDTAHPKISKLTSEKSKFSRDF